MNATDHYRAAERLLEEGSSEAGFLKDRDATSVSSTTARGGGSGKFRVARLGDEREELV
jgi:hypothetical protein